MAAMLSTICRCLARNYSISVPKRSYHQILKGQTKQSHLTKAAVLRSTAGSNLDTSVTWTSCEQVAHSKNFHTSLVHYDSTTVKVPPFAESVSEGDVRWEKAAGDTVEVDEVICEIETDKTAIPVNAPFSGVIEALLVEDGTTVTAGTPLFKISTSGEGVTAAASPPPPQPEPTPAPPPPAPAASGSSGPIPSAPPVLPSAAPTPGQPISTTTTDKITPTPYKPPTPPTAAPSGPPPGSQITGSRTEQRVKMNRMRMRIAQRLKDAQNTNAMLTTFNEIDMSNITEMRANFKETFLKKHNMKLGFMSAFVKAAAYALQDQPVVNAVIDENDIVYRDYIDISVAVATPKGLVVPVIRNVEKMNFAAIEKTINALGEKARTGSLAIEDMDGGTFTISNGGVFGSMFGTPIINPPQSAILGMHGIFDRPVAVKGKVEIRPMMYVALTYDHRLIDGREAVMFLRKIKESVEDPRVVLLDI